MAGIRHWDAESAVRLADPFDRIVDALHRAALDDAHWPRALALIDTACGMAGSYLAVVAGLRQPRLVEGWFHGHGERNRPFERDYAKFFAGDERVARLLLLPSGTLIANAELCTEEERQASAVFREFLPRWDAANQLNVCLPALGERHTLWMPTRTQRQGEWRPSHLRLLRRLLPHVGQAMRVRQALAQAAATVPAQAPAAGGA